MVFFLSDALIKDGPLQQDYYLFVQTMMIAYKEGKHILIISPRNTAKLIADLNIDETSKAYLRNYQAHGKESIGYFKIFKIIIEIIPLNEDEGHYCDVENQLEFRRVHFSRLTDTSTIQKTILLGENGNDATIYSRFAEYYIKHHKLKLFKVAYKPQTGGGSTLYEEYKRIYEEGEEFCLCIVDSDRNAPKAGIGSTAKRVWGFHSKVGVENPSAKCDCHVLSTLEVENLFPADFYRAQYTEHYYDETHRRLATLKNVRGDAFLHHDFKKGLRSFVNQENHILNEYWLPVILACDMNLYEYERSHYYLNGFGNQILANFVNYDKETLFDQLDECNLLKPIWLELGKVISSFILTTNRRIAV